MPLRSVHGEETASPKPSSSFRLSSRGQRALYTQLHAHISQGRTAYVSLPTPLTCTYMCALYMCNYTHMYAYIMYMYIHALSSLSLSQPFTLSLPLSLPLLLHPQLSLCHGFVGEPSDVHQMITDKDSSEGVCVN